MKNNRNELRRITERFIQGVYLGLQSAIAMVSGAPVHIIYAGTGPFATLAIPMTTIFTSRQIRFTFIEINPHNIKPLQNIIQGFEAENFVTEILQQDATRFQTRPARPFQMIIVFVTGPLYCAVSDSVKYCRISRWILEGDFIKI